MVGPTPDPNIAAERFVPAIVPGSVQLDWARAENWPPYWLDDNFRAYAWTEDRFWIYRATLPAVSLGPDERLFFVCGGVDYRCTVRIGGNVLHEQEGMFTPFEFDVSEHCTSRATLEIVVFPAPKRFTQPTRAQASASVKPAVSYGWDWHPRLIPLGLWQWAGLEVRPQANLRDVELRYVLSESLDAARIWIDLEASSAAHGLVARWKVASPEDEIVLCGKSPVASDRQTIEAELLNPRLWWPHDHGRQPLYRLTVELVDSHAHVLDRREQRVGFRRVKLVMHEGAWDEPATFPKTRSHPPVTLEINDRRIFAKGSNFVNPEIFPGLCDAATYRPLLQLARDAHFNLLRCWGGAPVQHDAFFDLCDEVGLLVWQEFPLACNLYPDDAAYLAVLDRESRSIIRRVRRHPCLALWCGGNELFNAWSGMTDQSLPLRLLNRNCFDLDPLTPYLPTAPIDGMGHGDYRFRDEHGREVLQIYPGADHTAYSEFGCPGPSSVEYLRTFIPEAELWPPRTGTAWQWHHGFGAWDAHPTTWLCTDTLQYYFGDSVSLEELVARGTWLQCAALQCIFEEARRQKPRCAMALNWCYNEPWPSAANCSIVNWPAKPKPAYAAVTAACRPVLASARIPKFSWRAGEVFEAQLWLLNDSPDSVPGGRMTATLTRGGETLGSIGWEYSSAGPDRNVSGPAFKTALRDDGTDEHLELKLTVAGHPEWDSTYRLHFCRPQSAG